MSNPYDTSLVPLWARPAERDRVYEALYRGSDPLLHLDPRLWRLVFDDERAEHGTSFSVRPSDGVELRSEPTEALDWSRYTLGYSFLDSETRAPTTSGKTLEATAKRQRRQAPSSVVRWPPPMVTRAAGTARAFEKQEDGHLCALHALNNVARCIVLQPPLMMEAIGTGNRLLRPNTTDMFAMREELFLAALRRGVVLGSLQLDQLSDLHTLSSDEDRGLGPGEQRPEQRALRVERLIFDAGGCMLLLPGGGGSAGHFVPVVPLDERGTAWCVYSMDRLVVCGTSVGGAISALLEQRASAQIVGLSSTERSRLSARQLAGGEVLAMVPLRTSVGANDLERRMAPHDALARYWTRYTINNATVSSQRIAQRTVSDIDLPKITPLQLHYVSNRLESAGLLSGADARNPFTVYKTQAALELELNALANELASLLVDGTSSADATLHFSALARPIAPPQRRSSRLVPPTDERTRRRAIVNVLRQMYSLLRQPANIGLLLGEPLRCAADSASALCSPIANRQWLRFVGLQASMLPLANELDHDYIVSRQVELYNWQPIEPRQLDNDTLGRLLALLCASSFTNLTADGDVTTRYPDIDRFWFAVNRVGLAGALPKLPQDAPLPHERVVAQQCIAAADKFAAQVWLINSERYERALWLLSSLDRALSGSRGVLFDRALLAQLQLANGRADDLSVAADNVELLDFFRRIVMERPSSTRAVEWRVAVAERLAKPPTAAEALRFGQSSKERAVELMRDEVADTLGSVARRLTASVGDRLRQDALAPLRTSLRQLAKALEDGVGALLLLSNTRSAQLIAKFDSARIGALSAFDGAIASAASVLRSASLANDAALVDVVGTVRSTLTDALYVQRATVASAIDAEADTLRRTPGFVGQDVRAAATRAAGVLRRAYSATLDAIAPSIDLLDQIARELPQTAALLAERLAFSATYAQVPLDDGTEARAQALERVAAAVASVDSVHLHVLERLYVTLGADTLRGTLDDVRRDVADPGYTMPAPAQRNRRLVENDERSSFSIDEPQSAQFDVLPSRQPFVPLEELVGRARQQQQAVPTDDLDDELAGFTLVSARKKRGHRK